MVGEDRYRAYLIRCQRTRAKGPWRIMLKNAQNGEEVYFASEREALHWLLEALDIDVRPDDPDMMKSA